MADLYCGTSGFAFAAWRPAFYPEKLPEKGFLEHYAQRLNCVEINYTFRRILSASTAENWVASTPPGFLFAIKAHMRLTHILRLKTSEFTGVFFRSLEPLRITGRLGPVLFQLAPNQPADPPLLEEFLSAAPGDVRLAFEFRHPSWFSEEIYDVLRKHGAALCLAESEKFETPRVVTAPFVYSRLRKPAYGLEELDQISRTARSLIDGGRDAFVLFKHEQTAEGAFNAEALLARFRSPLRKAAGSQPVLEERPGRTA